MRILLVIAAAACIFGQSVSRPILGRAIDRHGSLHVVVGTAGSFVLKAPVIKGVVSFACSDQMCVAKTDSAMIAAGTLAAAQPGPALIALDGARAFLYFPQTRQFSRWDHGMLTNFELAAFHSPDSGEVLSIRAVFSGLQFAVRRGNGVWIVSQDGSVLDSLPPDAGPVLLLRNGAAYAESGALVLRRSDGSEIRFNAPGVDSLFAMGNSYVEARAGALTYALRTEPGQEHLFVLPEPRRAPEKRR